MKPFLRENKVRHLLIRKNKSQNWLALRLGISSAYMSQLLDGSRRPSPRLRELIMETFGEPNFDELFIIKK